MKKVAILALLVAVLCLFAACPSKESSADSENTDSSGQKQEEVTKMYITIYGNKIEVALEQNSAVKALVELLQEGDITYTANDYGGFEKVGNIGHTLPTNNSQITTKAGDVVLYQGNQICIMVGSNSWSYTRIGKIEGHTASELKNLIGVGKGSAEVTLILH